MPRTAFLPRPKAQRIHNAALRVLERTGIWMQHAEGRDLCRSAGACLDDQDRVCFPPHVVHDALYRVRRRWKLYDRDGRRPVRLAYGRTLFGPGSDALFQIDRWTGAFRKSVLADVRENVRLVDSLGSFDFVMSMALPEDVAPRLLYATVFAEMVRHTAKPLVATATDGWDIEQIHRIACAVAGGAEGLRERPFFIAYLEPISPLRLNDSIAERVIYCARHEIPMLFAAGANCGGGAPVTPEGGVVQGTAECLAGLVLAMAANDNARFLYGANTSSMDMRTSLVCYGAPEWFKTVAMYADMGRFYRLATWGTAGCSDSFGVDAQAAWEAAEGIDLAVASGATLVHDVGFLAHGTLYDARMLVLTDEMLRRARYLHAPADVTDEALAVEVIDDVARSNTLYLAHPHTLANFRRTLWLPPAFVNRRNTEEYHTAPQFAEALGQAVADRLAAHTPRPLAQTRRRALDACLASLGIGPAPHVVPATPGETDAYPARRVRAASA
jgi:trimethylamine--corrinoid protein Co-methyltransferase